MNDEEKELINNIERALNLSEVKGDLVTIIYNYIVKATINLINKLQKELDKKDKIIEQKNKLIKSQKQYIKDLEESRGRKLVRLMICLKN